MGITRSTHHLGGPSGPWIGANFWSRHGGPHMWRAYDDQVVRQELKVLADHGLNVTRSFLFWPDFHPRPDVIDETLVGHWLRFLAAHEDLGLRTIPTFLVGHMSGENFDVPWRHGRDLYRDGAMLGQQIFFIREMTRRGRASQAIAGWLISNEFPHYAGDAPAEYVRAWGLACTAAVRAGGSELPVSLGDGSWGADVTGVDNGYSFDQLRDVVDFVGPHAYSDSDDQLRQMSHAAVLCELAATGLPVILEEFGVSSAAASDRHAADYYRQTLHLSLLGGATGWLAWNNTDFALDRQDPYRHHLHELRFGVTTATGEPKPVLRELRRFAHLAEVVDLGSCRRSDTSTAVLVPSYLSDRHPLIDPADRQAIPPITHHAYLAAKRAGLAPAIIREGAPLPDDGLILAPSVKALTGPGFAALATSARGGAHVYVSYFAGVGGGHKGAWWPPLEDLFGVRHDLRYGVADLARSRVTATVGKPLGSLVPGTALHFDAPDGYWARAYLPVEPVSDRLEILLSDEEGRPILTRMPVGSGAMYLGTHPLEHWGAVRPNANADDAVWSLYRALGEEAGALPIVHGTNPDVVVDSLMHADGTRLIWLVNISDRRQSAGLCLPDGLTVTDVESDHPVDASTALEAFGVVVGRLGDPAVLP